MPDPSGVGRAASLGGAPGVKHIGPEGGSVINIGSAVTSMLPPNTAAYAATKAGVDAITGVLAKELGQRRIRVNSINPGMIETEGLHAAGPNLTISRRPPSISRRRTPST